MPKNREGTIGFPELHTQLRIISRLLAAQLKASLGQQEMVRLLSSTNASSAEIADVLDTTSATVNATLQRLKKRTARIGKSLEGDNGTDNAGGGGQ
jgi:DNA-binding CsgD family transcriptional regulator